MKLFLVFLFTALMPTQAEWSTFQSVWEKSKQEAYGFEGVIKTIFVDEEHDRIIVRVQPIEESESSEEFVICEDNVESARNQRAESSKISLIRQAFATGSPVRLGFSGSFERCLSSIKYLKADSGSERQVGI